MQYDAPDEKRSVHRSPNYPSSSLGEAIEKARAIYEKERRAGAPRDIVLRHIGYNSPNGAALRSLATLKKFGLIEERDERIFISKIGLDILVYPSSDERHKNALKESALKPSIYAQVLERYKDVVPSAETIKAELVREYGFNDKVVGTFLDDFYATLDYAGLSGRSQQPHEVTVNDEVRVGTGEMGMISYKPKVVQLGGTSLSGGSVSSAALSMTYPIPLKKQNQATITFARMPLEKKDLELLKQWIDLMEENLTEALPQEDQNANV